MLFRSLSEKSPSESYTEFIEIVFPEHANSLGITFGGQILKWMEYTAIMAAAKHCRSHLLTASMDSVTFLRPTKVGDVVIIKGIVSQAFEHSIEVYVTVEREHLETCEKEITNNGYLTVVSVDQKGQLLSVTPLQMESEEERARGEQGKERQKRRLEERKEIDKLVY
jgi:acyl-CoA hydrolase